MRIYAQGDGDVVADGLAATMTFAGVHDYSLTFSNSIVIQLLAVSVRTLSFAKDPASSEHNCRLDCR
jgi:hypothetical protein